MFYCENGGSFGLKSQCFTAKKEVNFGLKSQCFIAKKGSFWAEKSVFCSKKGVIFKLENKDGYHLFQWVREPGSVCQVLKCHLCFLSVMNTYSLCHISTHVHTFTSNSFFNCNMISAYNAWSASTSDIMTGFEPMTSHLQYTALTTVNPMMSIQAEILLDLYCIQYASTTSKCWVFPVWKFSKFREYDKRRTHDISGTCDGYYYIVSHKWCPGGCWYSKHS